MHAIYIHFIYTNFSYLLFTHSRKKIIIYTKNNQEIVVVIQILCTVDCLFALFSPPIIRHSDGDSDTVAAPAIGDGRSPT